MSMEDMFGALDKQQALEPPAALPTPTGQTSPLDSAFSLLDRDKKLRATSNLADAQQIAPDQAARALQVSRTTGIPVPAVEENLDEAHRTAQLQQGVATLEDAPKLTQFIADNPLAARLAQDDLDNLSSLEKVMRHATGAPRALAAGVTTDFNAAVWGWLEAGAKMVGAEDTGDYFRRMRRTQESMGSAIQGEYGRGSMLEAGVASGFRSFGSQAPATLASVLTANPMFMLGTGSAIAGGQSVGKGLEAGLTPAQAINYGMQDAVAEWATEMIPVGRLLKDLNVGAPFLKMLGRQMITEVPTEMAATAWQNFNEWSNLHPEQTMDQYLEKLGPDEAQTIVATVTQTILSAGLASGSGRLFKQYAQQGDKAGKAQEASAVIQQIDQLTQVNKLRQRDPDTFNQFVKQLAEDGPVQDLYVSPQAFMQSGIDIDQLARDIPAIAQQMESAAAGNDIRIPVEDFLTKIAGTDMAAALTPHLKTEVDGMSQAEAEQYLKTKGDQLKADVEKTIGDVTARGEFQQSLGRVQENVLAQLDKAGRFTGNVNQLYANLIGARFATLAQQMNITPEEAFAIKPLKIQAEGAQGNLLRQEELAQDPTEEKAIQQAKNTARTVVKDAFDEGNIPEKAAFRGLYVDELKEIARTGQLPIRSNAEGEAVISATPVTNGKMEGAVYGAGSGYIVDRTNTTASGLAGEVHVEPKTNAKSLKYLVNGKLMTFNEMKEAVLGKKPQKSQEVKDAEAWLKDFLEGKGGQFFQGTAQTFAGFTREEWLGNPKITKDSNAGDIVPRAYSFLDTVAPESFMDGKYTVKISPDGAAVFDGDKVIASYNSGDTLVVDKKYRRQGIAEELVYQWRKRYPAPAKATTRTKASQAIQERVWDRLQREKSAQLFQSVDQTETPEFKRWFGDSVVREPMTSSRQKLNEMPPKVVYHATSRDFVGFETERETTNSTTFGDVTTTRSGIFFAEDPKFAEGYGKGEGQRVMPVYLSIKNPIDLTEGIGGEDITAIVKNADGKINHADFRYLKADEMWQLFDDEFGRNFVDAAKKAGFDGAYMIESDPDTGESQYVWVAFDPEQIKSAIGNRGTFDANNPNILEQGEGNRGAYSPEATTITLFKHADLSSFLHETGHFFLDLQAHLASLPEAPQAIKDDMETLLEWFGVKATPELSALDAWNAMSLDEQREFHENFARGFEAYLFEGKAPNVELQGVFSRFRAWLVNVYKAIKNLNVELTPEVRGVMDRMLATQEEIEAKQAADSMGLMFKTQEEANKFGLDWAKYHGMAQDSTAKAVDELTARSLKDMQWFENAKGRELKRLQKDAAEKRAEVKRELRPQILSSQLYRTWAFLTGKQEMVSPGTQAEIDTTEASGKLRLNVEGLEIDEATKARLRSLRMTSEESGMHPDVVAELFGYSSGAEMIQQIVSNPTPNEAVNMETDRVMLERYGDITSPEALERAAMEAVHNTLRQKMVAAELKALESAEPKEKRGRATVKTLPRAAKMFAEGLVNKLKVRDIKPRQYEVAEARAAREAEKALKAGKTEEAATQKRNQLINGYATRAALDAQAEVEAARRYFRKFDSDSVRKAVNPSYTDQIDQLLERYEFRAVPLKTLEKRRTLAEWLEKQHEMGLEPDIPADLVETTNVKNYRDMTMEELRGLVDTVKQIEHLGKLKNKLLTAKDQREYAAARDEMVTGIIDNSRGRKADTRTPNTVLGEKLLGLKNFWASHIKAATWARVMDGGKDGGPIWEYLIRPANEAGNKEVVARAKATEDLTSLMKPVLKQGNMGGKGQPFPTINRSLNREARIAMALNTGNEGNMQRLLDGEGWTREQIAPVLDTLTKEDWDFVQSVWDYFETFRPEIAAKERRVYGKEPDWIKPVPVQTKHGEYRGGYYPIKYDPRASSQAEEHADAEAARQLLKGAYTSATTKRSFTKTRAEQVRGRPLMYSLDGIYSGVNEIIHDLSWHEWLIDANRLLKSESISTAMRETYGPEAHKQFKDWARDIAVGNPNMQPGEKFVAWIRQGVSITGLGANVMSAMIQPFGITQSIVRVGPKWVGRGIAKSLGAPIDTVKEINEKSDFMRTRVLTRMRELAELRNRVRGQSEARRMMDSAAYFLMLRAQQIVDVPTWWGAYEKAIAGGNDEARSIALADQAVIDSQGSGTEKDQAAIERGGAALKLFTVFYSFQNTALNIGVAQTMTAQNRAKLAADYLLLYVVPVILMVAMKEALVPGGDDDPEKLAKKMAAEEISFLFGLMFGVREFAGAVQLATGTNQYSSDYQGPAGIRMISDVWKLGQQIGQGEIDDGLRKAIVNVGSELLRLPGAQINRTITGAEALQEGDTENPMALLFGYDKQ